MDTQREQVAEALLTAAIVSAGFATGNPVITSVVGGIGVNWAADLTREAWGHACRRLLGESGLLNHDLQQALVRAFRQAMAHLEQTWWQRPQVDHLRRHEPEVANLAGEAFKRLREHAKTFFAQDRLGRATDNEQVRQILYGDEVTARQALSEQLAIYLDNQDAELVAFIEKHLVRELAFWFGEELKADRPASNRAWRAFQRLLLEGLQDRLDEVRDDLAEIRTTQQEMNRVLKTLQAWDNELQAETTGEWERRAHAALEATLAEMRDQLLDAMAREHGLTRAAIEAGLTQITRLLREELAQLRRDLLPRLEEHGLAQGAAPLRVDLRRHFARLLRDYALFGGRTDEMDAIRRFLDDPEGGYLLVTGPSGYGKTALLTQLVRQGDAVVYHFIQRAYGTADEDFFLRNLCQQLANRHGLGGRLPVTTTELRALYPILLRLPPADGRPVVVLIDGLDEALNWEPGPQHFPPDLPDGVKVIFSAREVAERDWLKHLHLPPERVQWLTLGTMTKEGVAALLRAAGGTTTPLADDVAWVREALRISEGDPFYLKLLVEDLRDERLQPEQIEAQPTGLNAYLRSWWEQIAAAVRREQDVRDVLGNLAVARGRLRRDDLVMMFPDLGWALDGVLAEVRRFVIGDEHDGYALCHFRFAEYVRQRVGPAALQTYTDALLAYCANWQEHHSPYALAHYAGHLAEAGRWGELHALVATGDEHQSWAEVHRSHEGSYAGYLADLGLAWAHANAEGETNPTAVGYQVRYALIQASINSLAGNIPPSLLVTLVREGMWTGTAALGYAQQVSDPKQRTSVLRWLGAILRERSEETLAREALIGALAAAREINEPYARTKALTALIPHMSSEQRPAVMADALTAAREIRHPDRRSLDRGALDVSSKGQGRADALAMLMPHTSLDQRPTVLDEALAAARESRDPYHRVWVLAKLVPYEPDGYSTILVEALAGVREIDHPRRAYALALLMPHIPPDQRPALLADALTAARVRENTFPHALALALLVPHIPPDQRPAVLDEVLIAAREMDDRNRCAEVLRLIAAYLSPDLQPKALAMAREIGIEHWRVHTLIAFVPHLPPDQRRAVLADALAAVPEIGGSYRRARALARLAPHLSSDLLPEALAIARENWNTQPRVEALAALASRLPPDQRPAVLAEALAAVREIRDEKGRARTLAALTPHVPPDLLSEVLAAAREIRDARARATALTALAPHLPADLLSEALVAAREITDTHAHATALTALAPHLPADLLLETLAAAREIRNEESRARTLAELAPHLAPDLLSEALATTREIRNEKSRARTLAELAPHLTPDLLSEALATAREIQDEKSRARTLAELAPHLSPDLLSEALVAAREIQDAESRASALTELAPRLPADQHPAVWAEVLAIVRQIRDAHPRARALIALAPHLPPDLLPDALSAAREIDVSYVVFYLGPPMPTPLPPLHHLSDQPPEVQAQMMREIGWGEIGCGEGRVHALTALLPRLPPDQRPAVLAEALADVREIHRADERAKVLAELALPLPPDQRSDVWAEALVAAREMGQEIHGMDRARIIVKLMQHLPPDLLPEALVVIREIIRELERASNQSYALEELVPHIPPDLLPEVLAMVQDIQITAWRGPVLRALATHMPLDLLPEVLAAAREIHDAGAFSTLAPIWAQLPRQQAYSLWLPTLQRCALRSRNDLLADLGALVPIIAALGGTKAVVETFRAIQDVRRWWP